MSMEEIYLTKKGHERLVGELEVLQNQKRRQLSKAIGEARAHGDLSENAEYDAAKDAQAQNEERISALEFKLSHARIIDDEHMSKDEVLIGATVTIQDLDTKETLVYMLVSELEADYSQGKISITSPVGKGLMNHKLRDEVEIEIPAGTLRYRITEISR